MTLEVRRAGEAVRFVVRDTGVGFDPAIAAQLFTPFQQADGSLTRKYGGTGLGLSISRDLARAMGGDISATATPGEGATFTVELPLPLRRPKTSLGPARTSNRPAGKPWTPRSGPELQQPPDPGC